MVEHQRILRQIEALDKEIISTVTLIDSLICVTMSTCRISFSTFSSSAERGRTRQHLWSLVFRMLGGCQLQILHRSIMKGTSWLQQGWKHSGSGSNGDEECPTLCTVFIHPPATLLSSSGSAVEVRTLAKDYETGAFMRR